MLTTFAMSRLRACIVSLTMIFLLINSLRASEMKWIQRAYESIEQRKFSLAQMELEFSKEKKERKNSASYAGLAYLYYVAGACGWYKEMYSRDAAIKSAQDDYTDYWFIEAKGKSGRENWVKTIIENARLAVQYDNKNALGHALLGIGLAGEGDNAAAEKEMELARSLSPNDIVVLSVYGTYYRNIGKVDAAIDMHERALKAPNPYRLQLVNLWLAKDYTAKGDDAAALRYLKAQVKANDTFTELGYYELNDVARFYFDKGLSKRGNPEKVREALEPVFEIIKKNDRQQDRKQIYDYGYILSLWYSTYSDVSKELANACFKNDAAKAIELVGKGADVNIIYRAFKQTFGKTPLLFAVEMGNLELVNKLLEAGANPNFKGDRGNTALHLLAFQDYKGMDVRPFAEALLKHGADINSRKDSPGFGDNTPLIEAAGISYPQRRDYVEFLVRQKGIDLNARNHESGKSAASAVYDGSDNSAATLRILLAAGAKLTPEEATRIYKDAFYRFPSGMNAVYVLLENNIPYNWESPRDEYAEHCKASYHYVKDQVVGKPEAQLWVNLMDADLPAFENSLKAIQNPKFLNYLSVMTINFTYGKRFYDALAKAGIDKNYNMVSKAEGRLVSGYDVFYKKKVAAPFEDLETMYHFQWEELAEVTADMDHLAKSLNRKASNMSKGLGDKMEYYGITCSAIVEQAQLMLRAINILKKVKETDDYASRKLSAESRKVVLDNLQQWRQNLKNMERRHAEEGCSSPFPHE